MEQLTLHVTGMHCGACEHRIQKTLSRLEGIRRSTADHQRGQVRVVFEPTRTSEPAIRACIEHAGYRVTESGSAAGTAGAPGASA